MLSTVNSSRLKTKYILALISVFLVGSTAFIGSARESTPIPIETPQASHPAFTLSASHTITRGNERERLLTTTQRFQRSDGVYKLVHTFYALDGTVSGKQTYFGFINFGVFRLDQAGQRLVFTGPLIDDQPADVEQFLRGHELFTREESVAGV